MPVKNSGTLINGNKILSEREAEVLKWAAGGLSNKAIANQLNICMDTVDTHNRSIVAKLKANNMKQAVAIGIRKGIIE